MSAYYNEFDPKAAAWLRELIKAGHIAPGEVDERSIVDVRPSDLAGYSQCHFFAGIGVWSHALRRAGWPDEAPIWTGSCPCQPFSAAGKGAGFDDERHLWPHFHYLIEQCQPAVVAGEQVASKDGLAWLDLVQADMEATGYAFGAVDTCAAGFGAPHIRQRLYWVGTLGNTANCRHNERDLGNEASSKCQAPEREHIEFTNKGRGRHDASDDGAPGGLAHPELQQRPGSAPGDYEKGGRHEEPAEIAGLRGHRGPSPTNGHWRDADWLFCRDGKWRPVEPGTFPLAHGIAARVGRLRGYGNAIVAPAAQAFIEAFLATEIMAANDNHCGVTFRPAA